MSKVAYPRETLTTESELTALGKLLLNGWSAEYALRITPIVNDEETMKASLHWTFPQAYYSVLFSTRALLLTMGKPTSNEMLIADEVRELAGTGYYPSDWAITGGKTFFEYLADFRIATASAIHFLKVTSLHDPITLHSSLVNFITTVNTFHERMIFQAIGYIAYDTIIRNLPGHLRTGFVGERGFWLCS